MGEILEFILGRYLYKEDIQDLLEDLGLAVSGSKDELIERLMKDDDFDPSEAVAYLDKEQLKDLCEELELSSRGTREELFGRVLKVIEEEKAADEEPEETAPHPSAEQVSAASITRREPAEQAPKMRSERRRELFATHEPIDKPFEYLATPPRGLIPEPHAPQIAQLQMVSEFLESYRPSRRFGNEAAYEIEVSEAMRHRFGPQNVKTQVSIYGGRIDIEVLGIGLEIKVPENRSQLHTLLGQVSSYSRFYGTNLMVVIFNDYAKVQDVTEFSNTLQDKGIRVFVK